jgi:hypothetical protein
VLKSLHCLALVYFIFSVFFDRVSMMDDLHPEPFAFATFCYT